MNSNAISPFFPSVDWRRLHQFFFWVTLLLLPTQLGLHFWPVWAQVLGRRVDYLSPTLYVTDIFILATLVAWTVSVRFAQHPSASWRTKIQIPNKNQNSIRQLADKIQNSAPILAGALFILVNIAFSVYVPVAIYAWMKVLEMGVFAYYIAKTKPNLSHVAFILSLTVLYSSLIVMGQLWLRHSIGGMLWFLGERTFDISTPGIARISMCPVSGIMCQEMLRGYGTFPHPNVLGGFLAVTVPFVVLKGWEERKIGRLLPAVSAVAGLVALVLTFSRSAWVAFAFGIIGIFTYGRMKNMSFRNISPMRVVGALVVMITLGTYVIWVIKDTSESVLVRQQLATAAVTIWQRTPLTGVGAGNFLVALPSSLVSRSVYYLQPVHNVYLLLLSEMGVIGVVGVVTFLYYLVKYAVDTLKQRKHPFVFCLLPFALCTILLLGLVDHYPLTLQQGQLMTSLFVGLVLSRKA